MCSRYIFLKYYWLIAADDILKAYHVSKSQAFVWAILYLRVPFFLIQIILALQYKLLSFNFDHYFLAVHSQRNLPLVLKTVCVYFKLYSIPYHKNMIFPSQKSTWGLILEEQHMEVKQAMGLSHPLRSIYPDSTFCTTQSLGMLQWIY